MATERDYPAGRGTGTPHVRAHSQSDVIEEKIAFLQSIYLFKKFNKNELHAFTMFFQQVGRCRPDGHVCMRARACVRGRVLARSAAAAATETTNVLIWPALPQRVRQVMLRGGTTVYSKGDFQNAIYFIKSGSCEAIYTRPPEILKLRRGRRHRRRRDGTGGSGSGGAARGRRTKTHRRSGEAGSTGAPATDGGGASGRGDRGGDRGGAEDGDDDEDDEIEDDDNDGGDESDESDGAAQRSASLKQQQQQHGQGGAGAGAGTGAGKAGLPSPRHVRPDDFHAFCQKAAVFEQGQWFGDISVFTDNVARYTVVAKGPVVRT